MARNERISFPQTNFPPFPCNEEIEKIDIKKISEKKEEEEKKIPYSFTPTCLLIRNCYNWAGVYGLDSSDGFLLYVRVQTRNRRNTRLKIQIVHSQRLMNM